MVEVPVRQPDLGVQLQDICLFVKYLHEHQTHTVGHRTINSFPICPRQTSFLRHNPHTQVTKPLLTARLFMAKRQCIACPLLLHHNALVSGAVNGPSYSFCILMDFTALLPTCKVFLALNIHKMVR